MHYVALAKLLILLSLANSSPVIAKRILGETYAIPIDGNAQFVDGRPLFGPSKTIRGVVVSMLVTALGAPLLGLPIWIGLLVAAAAMSGDLLSSFLKRRLGLTRQQQGNWSRPDSGIAVPVNRLPFYVLSDRSRHRGRLRNFSCRRSISLPSLFPAEIARSSLLRDLQFSTLQAMQRDFRETVDADGYDR